MEKLLTPNQVCELLQVKRSTLYSWTFAKKIPHLKVNGVLRFQEKSITEWIKKNIENTRDL